MSTVPDRLSGGASRMGVSFILACQPSSDLYLCFNYQSTSFHDALYSARALARNRPEFDSDLVLSDDWDHGQRGRFRLARWHDPNGFCKRLRGRRQPCPDESQTIRCQARPLYDARILLHGTGMAQPELQRSNAHSHKPAHPLHPADWSGALHLGFGARSTGFAQR